MLPHKPCQSLVLYPLWTFCAISAPVRSQRFWLLVLGFFVRFWGFAGPSLNRLGRLTSPLRSSVVWLCRVLCSRSGSVALELVVLSALMLRAVVDPLATRDDGRVWGGFSPVLPRRHLLIG